MKNILVPFDFSKYAQAALDFAVEMSKTTKSTVTLLYVIEYSYGAATSFNLTGEVDSLDEESAIFTLALIKRSKQRLSEVQMSEKYKEYSLKTHIMMGNPYEGITNLVDEIDVDLIVMGTKGVTGLKEILIGSNAEKIVRNAKCPVITIHKDEKFRNLNSIVYPTDLNPAHASILGKFKKIQKLFDAKIHLVWINTPHSVINEEFVAQQLKSTAIAQQLENFEIHIIKGFNTEEGILAYSKKINADMIALATHSRKGLTHLFLGSIAEDIANHATTPVWTQSIKSI